MSISWALGQWYPLLCQTGIIAMMYVMQSGLSSWCSVGMRTPASLTLFNEYFLNHVV